MKKLLFFTAILSAFLTLWSCEADDTHGTVTFYMKPTQGSWSLIVDGTNRGVLDQTDSAPDCEETGFITLTLEVGEYDYDVKSNSGYAWGGNNTLVVEPGCKVRRVSP